MPTKTIVTFLLILAVATFAVVIAKTGLIKASIGVGWSEQNSSAHEELSRIDDVSELRYVAESFAKLEHTGTKALARYVVYLYLSLVIIGALLCVCAFLLRSASNKALQQTGER